ncbi:oxidation resistance protein 1-like isoform X2 [Pomacea canaliculata]|uniref:oxidation resistance protein 1-like isoform X2 n=1 Tax=Pomacea canaliculata TaxID=400727 RepID=UPI000D72E9E8|nr:oxidation resistance protein 1-like isoform X2 [Pomacea canaliculata]XP_025090917.1 oxidation resistance protein 1-like isoform X2 [Pomacea canaliculata]
METWTYSRGDIPIIKMADKSPEHVPGHVMKVSSPVTVTAPTPTSFIPPRVLSEEEAKQLDEECFERFIKLTAKYISDGMGVVPGTLLVTPNAIMFDPNANDPLVMENGPENYGVIVVMESIQSAALYHDPAAMTYCKLSNLERNSSPKPAVYHGETKSCAQSASEEMTFSSKTVTGGSSVLDSLQGVTTKNSISGLSPFFEHSEKIIQDKDHQNVSRLSSFFSGTSESSAHGINDNSAMVSSPDIRERNKIEIYDKGPVMDTMTDKAVDKKRFLKIANWEEDKTTDNTGDSSCVNLMPIPDSEQISSLGIFQDTGDVSENVTLMHGSGSLTPICDTVVKQFGSDEDYSLLLEKTKQLPDTTFVTPASVTSTSFSLNEVQINNVSPCISVSSTTILQEEEAEEKSCTHFDDKPASSLLRSDKSPSMDGILRVDTAESIKPADGQADLQDFSKHLMTMIYEPAREQTGLDSVREIDSKLVLIEGEGIEATVSSCKNKQGQCVDKGLGDGVNASNVQQSKGEYEAGDRRHPVETDTTDELSCKADAVDRQKIEEKRIGNIVYVPFEKKQEGEMIFHSHYSGLLPTAPFNSLITVDSEADLNTRDLVEDSATSSGGSKPRTSSGSFSPLRSSAQHISSFVNYATGLFRSTNEDRTHVKDVTDSTPSSSEKTISSENEHLKQKQSNLQPDKAKQAHSIDVENAIKADERPNLFQPIEKLIPRPAVSDTQPPLYLHLHVGQDQEHRNVTTSVPWETYRKSSPKPDYWFSVPRAKADNLYAFFVQWRPEIYGDSDDFDPEEQGFVVVQEPDIPLESVDENLQVVEEHFGGTKTSFKKDWEIVSWKEALRRQSVDTEPSIMPELNDESSILNAKQIYELSESLPPRTIGYKWSLIYSTAKHGFSLNRLYREMAHLDSPVLLVVMDTAGYIFGAFINTPLKVSDHFYGTGECCLWAFRNELKMYRWTGQNTFFIKGNFDSISIGASEGKFGLWLDGDLYHGRSHRCSTFDNEVLSSSEDFLLKGLEAWSFGD